MKNWFFKSNDLFLFKNLLSLQNVGITAFKVHDFSAYVLKTNYLGPHPFTDLALSFFLSYFISSPTPFSCYCNPSAVATHVHYMCVMHREAKRKRENRISSASPPVPPLNHRYRSHTFSFGLSAQKKREEGEKGRRGRRKEQMWRRFEGTKLRSQSSRRRIDLNHSLNKNAFLSYCNHDDLTRIQTRYSKIKYLSSSVIWFIIVLY